MNKNKEIKNKIKNLTVNDIDYEYRINSLKADENVKNKALEKYKEINGSKESSTKAQQYLDNLLKIPFGIIKEEKILKYFINFKHELNNFINLYHKKLNSINKKCSYLNIDQYDFIINLLENLFNDYDKNLQNLKENSYNNYDKFIMNCYNIYLKLVLFIYSNNYKLENIDIKDLIEKTKDFDEVECIVNNAILENNTKIFLLMIIMKLLKKKVIQMKKVILMMMNMKMMK